MDYNIQIAGFSTRVYDVMELMSRVNKISKNADRNCNVQLLNADGIGGKEHILHATLHAIKAFERNENIANDIGLEICVRASAQRQISKALDILGIKEGEMNICAVAVDCSENIMNYLEKILGNKINEVLKPDEIVLKKIYKVSDEEIESAAGISNVMIERTTLLILEI